MGPWLVEIGTREELVPWLGSAPPRPDKAVRLVVRGDGPAVRELIPNALDAAKLDPVRVVLWVREASLFTGEEATALFSFDQEVLGAVISGSRTTAWVRRDRVDVASLEFAFATA